MSNRKRYATEAIRQVALQKGIPINEIYYEIERAVETALRNSDPEVQHFWHMLTESGRMLTPEDLILYIADNLSGNNQN